MSSEVTIVISNYNYGEYVVSAINSCLAQTVNSNILVVDDHSTDNSWDVISKYKDRIQAVRLSCNSGGNACGKNVGIAMSKTPYITCLDSDDMLLPHSIEYRLNAIGKSDFCHGWAHTARSKLSYPEIMGLKPSMTNPRAKKNYDGKVKPIKRCTETIRDRAKCLDTRPTKYVSIISASTVLAKRSLYEELGLYDEYLRWAIDREMWHRWLWNEKKVAVIPYFVSIYRKHGENITMNPKRKKPHEVEDRYRKCLESRRLGVNDKNTKFPSTYNYRHLIDEVL